VGSIPTASTIFLRSNRSLLFRCAPDGAPAAPFSAGVQAVLARGRRRGEVLLESDYRHTGTLGQGPATVVYTAVMGL